MKFLSLLIINLVDWFLTKFGQNIVFWMFIPKQSDILIIAKNTWILNLNISNPKDVSYIGCLSELYLNFGYFKQLKILYEFYSIY